jgi:N-methylhydantoinase A
VSFQVGIDIGGTFTDAVLMDAEGTVRLYKTPTTPVEPAEGVNDALRLAEQDLGLPEGGLLRNVDYFGMGTTVALNAMLERKGSPTGLITTRGFRDTLLMQRGMGQWTSVPAEEVAHYSARRLPLPIVPRQHIAEITERVDVNGDVIVPLDEEDVRAAVRRLVDGGAQAIAVCLLWSFRNPAHEDRVGEIAAELAPDVFVTLSSRLAPLLGEYERTATAAMNAYLGPRVRGYMLDLERSMVERGLGGPFRIMDSSGGVVTPDRAGREAVSILTSGPAGGVLASVKLADQLRMPNVLTTDMGGTSFDVGMIVDGRPLLSAVQEVGGYHVLKPAVKVTAIGAGGGSIARVDDGQLLVGPTSAGAVPGPACYGRGGGLPTVTDADVALGIIDPKYFLGGRFPLDREAAERAIDEHIAGPLGLTVPEAAAGIKTIADHRMADLLETLTIGTGYDPRDFVIYAYGGAGGTHCHAFGSMIGVREIVIPYTATVHSAFGAAMSDLHISAEATDLMLTPANASPAEHFNLERMNATLARLREQTRVALLEGGAPQHGLAFEAFVDMRYRMQTQRITVPLSSTQLERADLDTLMASFVAQYEAMYGQGSAFRAAGIELVSFRVDGHGALDRPDVAMARRSADAEMVSGERELFLGGHGALTATVLLGEAIEAGTVIDGPAVIEYPGTTILVGPGQRAEIDAWGNTRMTFPGQGGA